MKTAIIVLNYNGKDDTLTCLQSIFALKIPAGDETETIVIDNASSDDSVKIIKKRYPDLKLFVNQKNLGFAGGNNIAIKWALKNDFDYVLFINNDTIADKNLLKELVAVCRKDQKIGLVSPKIYFAKGYEFHKKRYKKNDLGKVIWYTGGKIDWDNVLASHRGVDEVDIGQYDVEQATDFATGCCILVKKEVFEKVGLFDKKYFLYLEDLDLNIRAIKHGYKAFYAPKAILWHKNASSSSSGSPLQDYYFTRNRLLFGFKYASFRAKIALIKEAVKIARTGRAGQKDGVMDFFKLHFGKK